MEERILNLFVGKLVQSSSSMYCAVPTGFPFTDTGLAPTLETLAQFVGGAFLRHIGNRPMGDYLRSITYEPVVSKSAPHGFVYECIPVSEQAVFSETLCAYISGQTAISPERLQ